MAASQSQNDVQAAEYEQAAFPDLDGDEDDGQDQHMQEPASAYREVVDYSTPGTKRTFSLAKNVQRRPSIAPSALNIPIEKTLSRRASFAGDAEKFDPSRSDETLAGQTENKGKPGGEKDGYKEFIDNDHLKAVRPKVKFILKLAKALLSFGAPSHRVEAQLLTASRKLQVPASFIHMPNLVIVILRGDNETATETHFVKGKGKIRLTSLHKLHTIYGAVIKRTMDVEEGTLALQQLLRAPAIYGLALRCFLAFVCSSIQCVAAFGGSFADMWIAGTCAAGLQFLGLNAAQKSSMYGEVHEITAAIFVSFIARGISALVPGNVFCYSAISSGGVILLLPGFTILTSALELSSRNILCGSVRMVYAIIYTLFLGFGLTLGSDIFLAIDTAARHLFEKSGAVPVTNVHGHFMAFNGTSAFHSVSGTMGITAGTGMHNVVSGCLRQPDWPWYRQPVPMIYLLLLVPLYSACSALQNLQHYKSWNFPVMIVFSCAAYAVNKEMQLAAHSLPEVAAAASALALGILGNTYARFVRGTAFTVMVTGVCFLVPSAIAQQGGLSQTYTTSSQQYTSGFSLALRMVQVAIAVSIGLFMSQAILWILCLSSRRRSAFHFAF